ncbi:MAG TPA: GDSL-type esterase/lipase family protein [Thermoanaerobaculia bacterium]|nr:GDSL-type esterase/lipase family protein [Thermoanaerobaculia bacterium]
MRRFVFWVVPLTVALAATLIFGWGFYAFIRGNLGQPVDWVPRANASAAAPRDVLTPIIVGDSLARGTGDSTGLGIAGRLDQELRGRRIRANRTVNLGINGQRTINLQRQLESRNIRTLLAQSNVVIVSIGGNDLWGGSDWRNAPPSDPDAVMGEVLDRIGRVLQTVREANPRARIFFIGLYNPFASSPIGAQLTTLVNRWNARLLERFGRDANFTLVQTSDLFSHHQRLSVDNFHPGDEGYALIARRIADSF